MDFNVNITVEDCCQSKCCTNRQCTTKIFTNLTDFICLQNGYSFKIISVTNSQVVIDITNGTLHFIRISYPGIIQKICLPINCGCHIITFVINSIESV